jgi:hypothetical protein
VRSELTAEVVEYDGLFVRPAGTQGRPPHQS